METRANYVIVGSVVLGVLAALGLFIAFLARSQLNEDVDPYYTYFSGSVAGLPNGGPVRYRGVPVGTVANIEIDPKNIQRIRVTMKIKSGTPIKTDSVAALEMAGITGGSYVEILGGTQESPKLVGVDDQIPVIQSQNSTLASLEEDAPKLLSKLLEFVDRANSALSPDNVKAFNDMLVNLNSVSSDLAALGPQAKSAAANIDALVANLRTELPGILDTVKQDGTAARDAANDFRKVADSLNSMIGENRGPLRDFTGSGLHEVTSLVTQLRGLTDTLKRVADRLDRDPQRYLFGGGTTQGVNADRPLSAGVPAGGK